MYALDCPRPFFFMKKRDFRGILDTFFSKSEKNHSKTGRQGMGMTRRIVFGQIEDIFSFLLVEEG